MKKYVALVPFLPASAQALECNGNTCAEISSLDTIIPTEDMLAGSGAQTLQVTEDDCAFAYNRLNNTPTTYSSGQNPMLLA
ncbi:hypothetical protein [Parendozoicomonas sp. Alg238-R29]|uniref:hypothetical protein n=1 Tax=Parendozoicomonas sp. Alg238-R29 TaxID=2993446 RepID=UPI00248F2C9A|nr:hypothetical protein [Parendozoicomonas sp. Alg238-R29]